MRSSAERGAAHAVPSRIPAVDFSSGVPAPRPAHLAVLAVSGIEWNDLGDPHRVLAVQRFIRPRRDIASSRHLPIAVASR
jgi:hypothetical protein